MKKTVSIVLAAMMSTGCLLGATACGGGGNGQAKEGTLTIRYFEGGYGSDWLKHAVETYKAKNEGFKYELLPDSTVTTQITTYLESGKNLSDIYVIQTGYWAEWVSMGYLANLQDVYEAEVETSKGKRKIKDYMDQDLVNRYYMQRMDGQGEYYPWVMPEASISISLVYNEEYTFLTNLCGLYPVQISTISG